MRHPDFHDWAVKTLTITHLLMALGPEILISPAHEHSNIEEMVGGLQPEKPCTGKWVCMYCTLNTNLSRIGAQIHLRSTFCGADFAMAFAECGN